jgi:hypothetical protein
MTMFTEDELKKKVHEGYMVESVEEMTEGYRKSLVVQLTVQADTELMSAPAYWRAAQHAPSNNTQVSAHAIIQDELAHANIAYRLLEDLGVSKEKLVYGREPHEFKHPYGFDQPLDNWAELVVANGFFDRAGITLLSDVYAGGPADAAGLRAGDVIIEIAGQRIYSQRQALLLVTAAKPGDELELTGIRDGVEFRATIIAAERPGAPD